jgi:vacuolar-type H+-ATPase subunit E/Vma4
MEEIVSADAIRGEILDDARKKAARMLEEAEEESARTVAAIESKAVEVVDEIMRTSEARSERFRLETMARLPLDRTRMRAVFVEGRLREALASYVGALSEGRVAELSEAMLARGSSYFSGTEVELRRKGLPEDLARAVADRSLQGAASVNFVEDSGLPASGLVARARDGSVLLRATMDLVEERLLDAHRSEIARALCADAIGAEGVVP